MNKTPLPYISIAAPDLHSYILDRRERVYYVTDLRNDVILSPTSTTTLPMYQ
jgi:hypothetical protein